MFKRASIKNVLIILLLITAAGSGFCFKPAYTEPDWLAWTNRCLAEIYNPVADSKLKKWEFTVNADDFLRLRKVYAKGREEYFSMNLHQFNDLDYLGSATSGTLQIKTMADDIIVQTRNDRHGDVDSMTTVLNIPIKNLEPERLDSLRQAFNYFKGKGM